MHTAICRTETCENNGLPIGVVGETIDPITEEMMPVTAVQCGPCGQPIIDIDPPLLEAMR